MKDKEVKEIKGYKGFDRNLKCRGFQYEVGKTYRKNGKIEMCKNGFHFCRKLSEVNEFYPLKGSRVCEVIGSGVIVEGKDKIVAKKIEILRELSKEEVLSITNIGIKNKGFLNTGNINTGSYNTGHRNTGSYNTGHRNSGLHNVGSRNTGSHNTGDRNTGLHNTGNSNSGWHNTGDRNSGWQNTGHRNSGLHNVGSRNTGSYNTGDRNTGSYNTGNGNSGWQNTGDSNSGSHNTGDRNTGRKNTGNGNSGSYNTGNFNKTSYCVGDFNTTSPQITVFNKKISERSYKRFKNHRGFIILRLFSIVFYSIRRKGKRRVKKSCSYKESWAIFWSTLSLRQRYFVYQLPFLDKKVFFEITGIKLHDGICEKKEKKE